MRAARLVVACVLATLASGCITTSNWVATYEAPTLGTALPRRILIVPFDGAPCDRRTREMIRDTVALEMQGMLRCDIVCAPHSDDRLAAESGMSLRGRVDIEALITAHKDYQADAFLFGTVTHYKPYDPPVIGLRLRLLSARTGDVIWASEALFDGNDRGVRTLARIYFKRSGMAKVLYGPDLIFMSPRLFSRFVAFAIVEEFQRHLPASS